MRGFTLHDLQCFDAVLRTGGFQSAADELHRSHSAVFAAVAKLERQLGLSLLDRSGYRVRATDAGDSLHRRARTLLREAHNLRLHAEQLAMGEEGELRVVIGDLCPRPEALGLLSRFFSRNSTTRLHLACETVSGPWEKLFEDEADLILHRVDKSDPRVEWIDLCKIPFVPVVAPGFLPFSVSGAIRPERLRDLTQCVIRDSARQPRAPDWFMVEGAPQCSVADQSIKKEIIQQGMAWGHLPRFLIERELELGSLLSIAGRFLPGSVEELVVARRCDRPHGPVAERLWNHFREQASLFRSVAEPAATKRGRKR